MELWIRSQDRTRLAKIKCLYMVDATCEEKVVICGYSSDESDDFDLGSYYTIERALEVLDEIQKLLMPQVKLKSIDTSVEIANLNYIVNPTYETIQQLNTCVYEMPKE